MIGRGYVESTSDSNLAVLPPSRPLVSPIDEPEPLPPRVPPPAGPSVANRREAKKPRRKKKPKSDAQDRLVKIGLAACAAGMIGLLGFFAWILFRPNTVVGSRRSSRGSMLARVRGEGGDISRIFTFESDGTAYVLYPDFGQWARGSYTIDGPTLRLKLERSGSWEKGEDASFYGEEIEYPYSFRHGWLQFGDEETGRTPLMPLGHESLVVARAEIARIPKGPRPDRPISDPSAEDQDPEDWMDDEAEEDGDAWSALEGE